MLLKCNSEGCSTCVGDSGQSYKNSNALLFSSENMHCQRFIEIVSSKNWLARYA